VYVYQNSDDRPAVLQINADLAQAQTELLSARCAVHRLRLQYSSDDLARLGCRDVLRKSAQAASALHEFYATIENKLSSFQPPFEPSPQQIALAVGWLSSYLEEERDYYRPVAGPIRGPYRTRMRQYFAPTLLERVQIIELQGARVRVPEFFANVRAFGFEPPEITHMDSITYLDVVAFNQALSDRALFHALVHVVQIDLLGLERYAELWIRSFLKTRTHFTVPLEVHAFTLTSKFLQPNAESFSVEDHVLRWILDDRY
jgi:hypothetical protein